MKLLKLTLVSVFMLFWTVGCETLDRALEDGQSSGNDLKSTSFVITLHQIVKYPRAKRLERKISSIYGQGVWININPYLHSRNIKEIKLVPSAEREGFFDLWVNVDRRGRILWIQLSNQFANDKLAFVIDGVFYRAFSPQVLTDDEDDWVVIKGPFDSVTAKAMRKRASKNFAIFNKDKSNKLF